MVLTEIDASGIEPKGGDEVKVRRRVIGEKAEDVRLGDEDSQALEQTL